MRGDEADIKAPINALYLTRLNPPLRDLEEVRTRPPQVPCGPVVIGTEAGRFATHCPFASCPARSLKSLVSGGKSFLWASVELARVLRLAAVRDGCGMALRSATSPA